MKRNSVHRAYLNIQPDEEAKNRMLNNILLSSEIPPAGKDEQKMRRKMKPMVIAAIIALMVMLMGCAIIVMTVQDLKIGERTTGWGEILDSEGNIIKETEFVQDVISLQGIQNTPAYLANQEWFHFTESYTPEAGDYWESDEAYWAYNVLNQTMVDKIDEICEKYGLKVIGKPWHEHVDCYQFLPLVGVESLLKASSDAKLHIPKGRFFSGGSFTVYGTLLLNDMESPLNLTYHCIKKDVFYDVFAYIVPAAVTEKSYKTTDGDSILLLESKYSGMIMVDREDSFISLSVDLNENASLEEVAEQFDFSIQTKPADYVAADAREQESINAAYSDDMENAYLRRETYSEYVSDLLWSDSMLGYKPVEREYAFYDLDGNGVEELLIVNDGFISNVVSMKDGKTDEGKSYHMMLCKENVLIDQQETVLGTWYHIFRFADNGDPVFANPKEQSIVRLKKENGIWWRTSSTEHYAEFDKQITEEEAMEILNTYAPIPFDCKPLTEFAEP